MSLLIAKPIVDWGALGQVAMISAAIGLVVTTALAIAVRTSLAGEDLAADGRSGAALGRRAITAVSVLVAVGVFVLGIYEIVSK